MIDVIIPVLDRPGNAQPLADSFRTHSPDVATLTFVCTPEDDLEIAACEATGLNVVVVPFDVGPGDYARKINYAYTFGTNNNIFMGADDIEFTEGWAETALRMMTSNVGVVATNDKANRHVMRGLFGTHNLISRHYIDTLGGTADNKPGVVLYEGYDHWYVDMELCDVAKSRNRFAFASRSVVKHRHPIWRTAEWDDTYRKGQAKAPQDHTLYLQRSPLFKTRSRDKERVRRGRVRR